jgi:hypothetical protein
MVIDTLMKRKPSSLGTAIAALLGPIAITLASGFHFGFNYRHSFDCGCRIQFGLKFATTGGANGLFHGNPDRFSGPVGSFPYRL